MKYWLPYPLLSVALLAPGCCSMKASPQVTSCSGQRSGSAAGSCSLPCSRRKDAFAGPLQSPSSFSPRARGHRGSNIAVARIVLSPATRQRVAGFLSMPLELRHPGGLAVMACIVTATPGTSWARYDAARNTVTIHVLDLVDEEEWIRTFKQRYERRLQEIFE
jgi:multicomponent K+:H+ antiporter subunit E